MTTEFETVAFIPDAQGIARQVPVTVVFELDGYKPIGLWACDEHENDVTSQIDPVEYDLLYVKARQHVAKSYCISA